VQPAKKVTAIEGIRQFFRHVLAELKKVNWPSRKELITYTIVVIVTVIVVSIIVFAWDYLLSLLFNRLGLYH